MKYKYRIAKKANGYFPQVKIKKFLFWSRWKKIAEHPSGYGLYTLPDWDYPITKDRAGDVIMGFHKWHKDRYSSVEYIEVNI